MIVVSRAEWGARPPRRRSTNIRPVGTAGHWNGPSIWRGRIGDHARCASLVRGIQAYHMDANGWVDLGYSAVACPHAYLFEGRWLSTRTAANGTTACNDTLYAVMALVGENDPITDGLLEAMRGGFDALDPRQIRPHSACKATSCPGDALRIWLKAGAPRPKPPPPEPEEDDMLLFRAANDNKVYVLLGDRRAHIPSGKQLEEAGFDPAKIRVLPPDHFLLRLPEVTAS